MDKKEVTFTRDDASEWLQELGFEDVIKLAESCIEAPKSSEAKNQIATVESGVLQTV